MQENSESDKKRVIRSFVVRSGRMTAAQKRGWEQYWPTMGLDNQAPLESFESLFGNTNPVVFEIGFGMGASLYEMALANPSENYIGVEVHRPGVGALLAMAGDAELRNLKVFCCDANDLIDHWLPENSLQRVQLFFPDPWHKKRHHKRRLVQPAFVQRIAAVLKEGGHFHLATDWEPYAEHMLSVMEDSRDFANVSGPGSYAPRPDYRPVTKFERRGQKLGHGVWDLVYQKSRG